LSFASSGGRSLSRQGRLDPPTEAGRAASILTLSVIKKIVSSGQTDADRAALDFAIEHGIPHGGWCPKGRLAEDDCIDAR